jgi:5-methylcytosine-specific restriction protein A
LFGHIAYLIIDEECTILIDDISIDENTKKSTLDNCYDNNSFIRIERIKDYNRPEKYNISTSNDIGINNSEQIEVFPDEIREDQKYYEGSTTRISVNRFERSNKARNICISNHKAVCNVCGFNFEKKYGQIGKGFIHVHHLVELSTINKKYHVDPEKDLIPVCPNCHAMLHAKTPPYTITELQHIIAQAG